MQSKSRFRSRSDHTLDTKGRLSFPSRFRDVLRRLDSDIMMITTWGNHLRAFTLEEWELLETKLLEEGREQKLLGDKEKQKNRARAVRYVLSGVNECNLDKQGRLLLPQSLRNEAKLQKEVVLVGMINHVEIWDKDAWQAENPTSEEILDGFDEDLDDLGII
ncbi:MAG: division/cell wall cluster transcriptional repressor MraZ [Desulfocapsaceae bacterium]|nr:division/cell wall cluster transcriptional repressor MraZ [Desulfocapsaceae bacterium]